MHSQLSQLGAFNHSLCGVVVGADAACLNHLIVPVPRNLFGSNGSHNIELHQPQSCYSIYHRLLVRPAQAYTWQLIIPVYWYVRPIYTVYRYILTVLVRKVVLGSTR
jgi:hypothetical protein